MTNYGLCYTFVPPPNKTLINDIGYTYGLSLILNVEVQEYYAAPRENVGFRIYVANENEIPDLQASGIDVSPGAQTKIAIRKSEITSLPFPYSDCIKAGAENLKYLSEPYTHNKCIIECESEFVTQHCSCRMYHSPGDGSIPFCSPKQINECIHSTTRQFLSMRNQICTCPEECAKEEYSTSMSFSVFPSKGIANILQSSGQLNITAQALGYYIGLYSTYKIFEEKGRAEVNDYLANFTSDFLARIRPRMPVNQTFVLSHCGPLISSLYTIAYSIKYKLTTYMSDKMYFGFQFSDPQYATEFNSSLYFNAKGISKSYLGELTMPNRQPLLAELDSCVTEVFHTVKYQNDEIYKEFFEQFFNVYYDEQFKFINSVFKNWLTTLIKENSQVHLTTEFIKTNYGRVDIYFETLKVTEMTDQPRYQWFSLICDLGGLLGLFFGASIVAFVEAIDFWCIQCCHW
ncbi:acid-sensing ion channel 3-like [Anneissia japonica]|uniref:acid-sensing ion channel 3-like n=1 Tax=Anneissia japonica TaxID=1529436 RepID=UPI00142569F5|nr:acid-sensing ion channel 3-like [Anneissia japonica]